MSAEFAKMSISESNAPQQSNIFSPAQKLSLFPSINVSQSEHKPHSMQTFSTSDSIQSPQLKQWGGKQEHYLGVPNAKVR